MTLYLISLLSTNRFSHLYLDLELKSYNLLKSFMLGIRIGHLGYSSLKAWVGHLYPKIWAFTGLSLNSFN